MYRDQVEGRKCRACRGPLPAAWSKDLCGPCISGTFWRWLNAENQRLYTFEKIDMFRGQAHRVDTRQLIG
jgi:hypothetical protein